MDGVTDSAISNVRSRRLALILAAALLVALALT